MIGQVVAGSSGGTAERTRVGRRELLLIRIWQLLRLASTSGKLTYQREFGFPDLHRSVVANIGNFDGATFSELVTITGREKAQISHAVTDLADHGIVHRTKLRAPVVLTPKGAELFESFMLRAEEWNAELTAGIPRLQVAQFLQLLQRLTDRAAMVLAHEQNAMSGATEGPGIREAEPSTFPERLRKIGPDRPMALLVAPRLMALFAYLDRGAGLTYRRLMNFSLFETIVLSHLGDRPETTLAELIELTDRNKGQVGRTIKVLEIAGLIQRAPSSSVRRVVLQLSEQGDVLAERMVAIAQQRDELIMEGMSEHEKASFAATLDALTANVTGMLRRQREVSQ